MSDSFPLEAGRPIHKVRKINRTALRFKMYNTLLKAEIGDSFFINGDTRPITALVHDVAQELGLHIVTRRYEEGIRVWKTTLEQKLESQQ